MLSGIGGVGFSGPLDEIRYLMALEYLSHWILENYLYLMVMNRHERLSGKDVLNGFSALDQATRYTAQVRAVDPVTKVDEIAWS